MIEVSVMTKDFHLHGVKLSEKDKEETEEFEVVQWSIMEIIKNYITLINFSITIFLSVLNLKSI